MSLARAPQTGTSIGNQLRGTVESIADDEHPALALVRVRVGASPVVARLTRRSAHALGLRSRHAGVGPGQDRGADGMKANAPKDGALLSGELRIAGRLDARFFALLQALHATGSINRAARTAGLSYKGAWLLLETACNLANEPLLETATGGAGGGGTRLTEAALSLLRAWQQLQSEHLDFVRAQEARLATLPALHGLMRRMSMKTTARNQFAGNVSALDVGPVSTQVTIALKAGGEITATLTSAAAKRLKLAKGKEALALIKASAVVLVTDFAGWQLSARNQLAGTISRVERGAVSSLVVLTLPGGGAITASVTNEGVDALGLAVGTSATAVFKAYSVMVAAQP